MNFQSASSLKPVRPALGNCNSYPHPHQAGTLCWSPWKKGGTSEGKLPNTKDELGLPMKERGTGSHRSSPSLAICWLVPMKLRLLVWKFRGPSGESHWERCQKPKHSQWPSAFGASDSTPSTRPASPAVADSTRHRAADSNSSWAPFSKLTVLTSVRSVSTTQTGVPSESSSHREAAPPKETKQQQKKRPTFIWFNDV